MERHKIRYIQLLKDRGIEVNSVNWISKREKQGDTWVTSISKTLRLEFLGNIPDKVYIGSMAYTVNEYIPEVTQCFNCQNFGHTSKHCHSAPVCIFCGEKGHRVKEGKCTRRNARCYNCKEQHAASYRGCKAYKMEKSAQKLRYESNINIHEARKRVKDQNNRLPPPLNRRPPPPNRRPPPPPPQAPFREQTDPEEEDYEEEDTEEETEEEATQMEVTQNRRTYASAIHTPVQPIEGTRWGPAREQQQPMPQRKRTRRRNREGAAAAAAAVAAANNTTQTAKETKDIVKDVISELIPEILSNITTIICKVLFTQGTTTEGKFQLFNEGILTLIEGFFQKFSNPPNTEEEREQQGEENEESEQQEENEENPSEPQHTTGAEEIPQNSIPGTSGYNPNKGRKGWKKRH